MVEQIRQVDSEKSWRILLPIDCDVWVWLGSVCIQDYLVYSWLHAAERSGKGIQLDTQLWINCSHVEMWLHH